MSIETVVGKGAHNYPCLRIVDLNDSIGKNNSDIQQLYSYVLNNGVDKQNISPEFKQYMSKISTEKCTYAIDVHRKITVLFFKCVKR